MRAKRMFDGDVAMDDPVLVRFVDGAADRFQDPEGFFRADRAAQADVRLEVAAVEILADVERRAVHLRLRRLQVTEVVDAQRVLVLQLGEGERLFEEVRVGRFVDRASARAAGALHERRAQELHAHDTIESIIVGPIDRSHPAAADPIEDAVAIEKPSSLRELRLVRAAPRHQPSVSSARQRYQLAADR